MTWVEWGGGKVNAGYTGNVRMGDGNTHLQGGESEQGREEKNTCGLTPE